MIPFVCLAHHDSVICSYFNIFIIVSICFLASSCHQTSFNDAFCSSFTLSCSNFDSVLL